MSNQKLTDADSSKPSMPSDEERYASALALAQGGDAANAIAALDALLADAPQLSLARNDLGALLFGAGDSVRAKRELARAFAEMPHEEMIVENYLEVLLATNAVHEISSQLQQMVGAYVQNTALLERMLDALAVQQADFEQLKAWDNHLEPGTQEVTDQVLPYLPIGGVLIDVGANCGLFSEQILREKNVTSYLFEPVPRYARYCAYKFRDHANITVENLALADESGTLTLYVDSANLGWNTLVAAQRTSEMHEVNVAAQTFDSYADEKGITHIDVIKIDVEGAEFRVLKGMRRTIARLARKPVIICEVGWGPNGHPQWDQEVEAFEWLFANGYQRCDYAVTHTSDVLFLPL